MNMNNITLEESQGWVKLDSENIGFNLLTVGGQVQYYVSSVDVAPTGNEGDIVFEHDPRIWDAGNHAWVKTEVKNKTMQVCVYLS